MRRRIMKYLLMYIIIQSRVGAQDPFTIDEIEPVEIIDANSLVKGENGIDIIIKNWDVGSFILSVNKSNNLKEVAKLIFVNEPSNNEFHIPNSFEAKTNLVEIEFNREGYFKEIIARFKINFSLHKVLEYEIPKNSQQFTLSKHYSEKNNFKNKGFILFKLEGVNKEIYSKRWLIFQKKENVFMCNVPHLVPGQYSLSLAKDKEGVVEFVDSRNIIISDFKKIEIKQ